MAAAVRTRWVEALRTIESQLPQDPEVCRDMQNWVELMRAAGIMMSSDSTAARTNLGLALDKVVDAILITMTPAG